MTDMYQAVLAFHQKFCPDRIGKKPEFPSEQSTKLRVDMIDEEVEELKDAIEAGDIVQVADALADIMYVVIGKAITFGIHLDPVFEEVHMANMRKEGGPTRADGKILKPEGWVPPDIARIIRIQGGDPEKRTPVALYPEVPEDVVDMNNPVPPAPLLPNGTTGSPLPPSNSNVIPGQILTTTGGDITQYVPGDIAPPVVATSGYLHVADGDLVKVDGVVDEPKVFFPVDKDAVIGVDMASGEDFTAYVDPKDLEGAVPPEEPTKKEEE